MLAYKVVQVNPHSGIVFSAVARTNELRVIYKVGEFVEAPVGGLLCFETLQHARDFQIKCWERSVDKWHAIFTCEGMEHVDLPQYLTSYICLESVMKVWNGMTLHVISQTGIPKGTIAFKRVMLLKKVQ